MLREHFQISPRNVTYVSNTIQNESIAALYKNMIEELKRELSTASCFSVMMDKASDLAVTNKCLL